MSVSRSDENYFQERTPKKNMAEVCLWECYIVTVDQAWLSEIQHSVPSVTEKQNWQTWPQCDTATVTHLTLYLSNKWTILTDVTQYFCWLIVNYTRGVCLMQESISKRKITFSFSKVSVSAYIVQESFHLQKCVNTEFDWEVKRGIENSVCM